MHTTRRNFLRNAFLGVGLLSGGKTWAGMNQNIAHDPTTKAPYRVVHGWPVLPKGFVLGQVSGVGVDSHNQVVVFHRAEHSWHRSKVPIKAPAILSFDGDTGKLTSSWGANMFMMPHGLTIDRHDNIWVTDLGLQQVLKFTRDGKLLMSVGVKGVAGLDGRHFNRPTDLAVAPDGSFYVADGYRNSRVAKFSANGEFLLDWGRKGDQPGEFNTPHGITLDSSGRVYVADRSNARIQVFNADGKFLYLWKSSDLGRPWAVEIGPDDYLYVVDGGDLLHAPPDRAHIMRLDLNGNILDKWSRFGNYDGQIYWGHDVAVSKNLDVYVGDVYHGMRVQKFTRSTKDCLCLED
jgi:peptidylamidoglycolate lyase